MRLLLVRNLWSCRLQTPFKQHILTVIKERIGNIIRTRYLAYDAHTYTMYVYENSSWFVSPASKLITWWDPEAGICTTSPSGPSAHTEDACGSGHRASWLNVCSCNRPDETREEESRLKIFFISFRYNQPIRNTKHTRFEFSHYPLHCCFLWCSEVLPKLLLYLLPFMESQVLSTCTSVKGTGSLSQCKNDVQYCVIILSRTSFLCISIQRCQTCS